MTPAVWEVRCSYLQEGRSYRSTVVKLVLCDSILRAIELVLADIPHANPAIDQILKRTAQEILVDPVLLERPDGVPCAHGRVDIANCDECAVFDDGDPDAT